MPLQLSLPPDPFLFATASQSFVPRHTRSFSATLQLSGCKTESNCTAKILTENATQDQHKTAWRRCCCLNPEAVEATTTRNTQSNDAKTDDAFGSLLGRGALVKALECLHRVEPLQRGFFFLLPLPPRAPPQPEKLCVVTLTAVSCGISKLAVRQPIPFDLGQRLFPPSSDVFQSRLAVGDLVSVSWCVLREPPVQEEDGSIAGPRAAMSGDGEDYLDLGGEQDDPYDPESPDGNRRDRRDVRCPSSRLHGLAERACV